MEKYRVPLDAGERTALGRLISAGKAASRKLAHARILLLADAVYGEGHRDEDIVAALSASLRTIARVSKRFVTEGIEAALDPKPRPARPDKIKIKGDVEQKLIKLACADPPRGRCHWTLQLLADEMVVLGLVDSISARRCGWRWKKRHSALDCALMVDPPEGQRRIRLADGGRDPNYMLPYDPKRPVICFDEASKQLFGEVRPPELARPGAPARVDYE
jgi:transposase